MTDEQRKSITDLRHSGYGYTAIAKAVGLSKDSVKAYCRTSRRNSRRLGLPYRITGWCSRSAIALSLPTWIGISIRDLDLLTIGMVNDMFVESHNDEYNYPAVATQEQMDRF